MATSLNDTSGTIGQTVIDVTSMIEHAVRRCGVSAALITAEQMSSARDNLFLILSGLATRGLSLWCVTKLSLGTEAGRLEYTLPVGTVDVLQALYRRATPYAATTVGLGAATLTPASSIAITSVLVRPAALGTYDLELQGSPDGVTWTTAGTATVVYDGATVPGVDATLVVTYPFWRVRDVRDPTRAIDAATFFSDPYEIPMSKLSRDDYANLPNKTFSSQWPLQYWYDKQFYQPKLVLWPVPTEQRVVRVFLQSQIQDPGAFVNAVQVPQRWLDAVISLLAPRVCLELPKELVDSSRHGKLEEIAERTLRAAEDSETDGAPIRLAPNISPYTR